MADGKIFDNISGAQLSGGFKLQSKQPLDARLVMDELQSLGKLVDENGAYEGMEVYVTERKTAYRLTSLTGSTTINSISVTGQWIEVAAIGSDNSVVFIELD